MNNTNTVIHLNAGRATVGIAPRIGGAITHFRWVDGVREHNWLRAARPGFGCRFRRARVVPAGSIISNRIRDGRFTFGGHSVQLPLNQWPQPHTEHGHGWQAAWTVVEHAADRLALVYDHQADAWPFPVPRSARHPVDRRRAALTLSMENRGREIMPAGLGIHPYFPRTAAAGCPRRSTRCGSRTPK